MIAPMLAQTEDDTIFLIALGVVLLFAVYQLVFSPDGVRVAENKESQAEETDFERRLFQKLDHTNDLLVSTRNSLLILIILVVILASLYLIFR